MWECIGGYLWHNFLAYLVPWKCIEEKVQATSSFEHLKTSLPAFLSHCKSPTVYINGVYISMGFPGGSDGKECAWNVEDLGLIPGSGRAPGERTGNPLQYSYLENPHGQRSLVGYSPWES